jgi:hypothetical protein
MRKYKNDRYDESLIVREGEIQNSGFRKGINTNITFELSVNRGPLLRSLASGRGLSLGRISRGRFSRGGLDLDLDLGLSRARGRRCDWALGAEPKGCAVISIDKAHKVTNGNLRRAGVGRFRVGTTAWRDRGRVALDQNTEKFKVSKDIRQMVH